MKMIISKFNKVVDFVVNNMMFLILLFCGVSFIVCVAKYSIDYPNYLKPLELLWLIPVAALVFLIVLAIKYTIKLCEKKYLLVWSVFFVIQSILFIVLYNSDPAGDGGGIYNEALRIYKENTFVLDETNYFFRCYWLMGTVCFDLLVMKLFGTSFLVFKCLSVLSLLGSGILLYEIVKKYTDKNVAKISLALFFTFIPLTLTVSCFFHQHIAFFLLMTVILLYEKLNVFKAVLVGVFVGCIEQFRPWGLLFLIAILCLTFYNLIFKKEDRKNKILSIVFLLIIFIFYAITDEFFTRLMINAGYIVEASEAASNMLLIKIIRGIDPEMDSFFAYANSQVQNLHGEDFTNGLHNIYIQRIKELLVSKNSYLYVLNKMSRMFGEVDYWFENIYPNKDSNIYLSYPHRLIYFLNWFQYIIMLPLSIVGYIKYRKNHTFCLLTVMTIGYFLSHIFIEAFSSYRVCVYPVLIMYASYFINELLDKTQYKKNIENKE